MNALEREIQTIRNANSVMRAANLALRNKNETKLFSLGFSKEHIEHLRMEGKNGSIGFHQQSIKNNNALIRVLKKKLKAEQERRGEHGC